MKKKLILLTLLGFVLCFGGCDAKDSTSLETSVQEDTLIQETISASSEEEIVEDVIEQIIVDENADGIENGFSQDIILP